MLETEEAAFQKELKNASEQGGTLEDLSKHGASIELPEYLKCHNKWGTNKGREIKTRFRLKGKYAFACDETTRAHISDNGKCQCCNARSETPFHFTRQCRAFRSERREMDDAIFSVISTEGDHFSYALMTENQKFSFLMGTGIRMDDARYKQWRAIELIFYRFLSAADHSRKRLLAQADGLSHRQASKSSRTES